jgi:hypothetical protein
MFLGRRPSNPNARPLSFSVMVDYSGASINESSLLEFLHSTAAD